MYLLHPVPYIMESKTRQQLYWPGIREAFYIEVMYCDACQRKKRSTNKYGKLPAKLAEETLWNKLCVDLLVPYKIRSKGK